MEQVAELRVHGVSGTPIESMLDDPWPTQVAGDDDGRIFRRTHDTPPDRVVEGYHWGRYTAGSPSRALWLLLIPFALVNVARFALLMPARRRKRDQFADGVLRLLGLLSTASLVVATCYLAWGVLARQCGRACAQGFRPLAGFADLSVGIRLLVTALLPIVLLGVLWQFDRLGFPHDPPGRPRRQRPNRNGDLGDPGFWRGPLHTSSQRAAHVTIGCAVAGLLALAMLGIPSRWWGLDPLFTVGCCGVALLLLSGLASNLYVVIGNPAPAALTSDGHDTTALSRRMRLSRYITAAAALAALALSAVGLDHVLGRRHPAHGVGGLFAGVANGVSALLGLTLLVFLVVCAWLALCAEGRALRDVPKPFRPFYGGMAAWMGASLGATAGLGLSAAAVFWTARVLGTPVLEAKAVAAQDVEVASVYWVVAMVWGGLALVLAVSLLPMAAWLLRRDWWWVLFLALLVAVGVAGSAVLGDEVTMAGVRRQAEWITGGIALVIGLSFLVFLLDRDSYADQLCGDYTEKHGLERARARVAARWRVALIRYRYHHVLGLVALLGGLSVIVAAVAGIWLIEGPGPSVLIIGATGPLGRIGVVVVSFGATGLAVLGLGTWRKPALRTGVGIVWDLLSFWPRTGHPLCPPPYGGRAVLAVAGRASQLANQAVVDGRTAERVVLSGHSQGSVITAAACAVLAEEAGGSEQDDDLRADRSRAALGKLSMITYGSQLQFLYARFFPSYFGYDRLCGVYRSLGGRWRSVYRWTDPLGGPVLAWAAPASAASFGPDIDLWRRIGCADDCPGHVVKERCGCSEVCPRATDPQAACPYPKYWAVGSDLRLRDPATIEDSAFEPRRAARGHSGYPGDPAYECVFGDLLDQMVVDPGPCGEPAQTTSAGSASQERISGRISMAPK